MINQLRRNVINLDLKREIVAALSILGLFSKTILYTEMKKKENKIY